MAPPYWSIDFGSAFTLYVSGALAFLAAGLGLASELMSADTGRARLDRFARVALLSSAGGFVLATFGLARSFLDQNYSLVYVVQHTRSGVSLWYRVAGLWGGLEGSLLLFIAIFGLVAAWVVLSKSLRGDRFGIGWFTFGVTLGGLGMINASLADPFLRSDIPAIRGDGLVPILEHPAMVYHPPLLYLGLVLPVVAFSEVVRAAVFASDVGESTGATATARRYLIAAVAVLIAGLATGANWAYVEQGWGGYWAWDPIENAALVPFLAIVAALHIDRAMVSRPVALPSYRVVMFGLPFMLAFAGALLTRSGLARSVHSFAEQPSVAVAMGVILAVLSVLLVLACLLAVRRSRQVSGASSVDPSDRPNTALVVVAGLSYAAAMTVGLGTLWPVVLNDDAIVQGSFFAEILGPIAVAGALVLAVIGLRARTLPNTFAMFAIVAVVGVGFVLAEVLDWSGLAPPLLLGAALLAAMGSAAAFTKTTANRGSYRVRTAGLVVAHLGFAGLLAALAGSTATQEQTVTLEVGERTELAGYELRLVEIGVQTAQIEPTNSVIARIELRDADKDINGTPDKPLAVLEPRQDIYRDDNVGGLGLSRSQRLSETAVRSTLRDDVFIALRNADDERALLEVQVRPWAMWLWVSTAAMASGTVLIWWSSRFKTT